MKVWTRLYLKRNRPHCDEGRVLNFGLETGFEYFWVGL